MDHLDTVFDAMRAQLAGAEPGDARRLFHGRGRCFPGFEALAVDWFPPVALVTLHDEEAEAWLGEVAAELTRLLGGALGCALVQRRYVRGAPTAVHTGTIPEPAWAREAGLVYRLRLGESQNIGFFGDMAPGRALVRRMAAGRRVLNLFAYTCSFSVAAVAGGAASVVNVDMSRGALQVGRQNHLDNGHDLRSTSFLSHDVFKSFGALRRLGPFDVIVLDPPTNQGRSFSAIRDWPKLLRRLPSFAAPGADLVVAVNGPNLSAAFVTELLAEHLPGARVLSRLAGAPDYPESDPDMGLKVFHARMVPEATAG